MEVSEVSRDLHALGQDRRKIYNQGGGEGDNNQRSFEGEGFAYNPAKIGGSNYPPAPMAQ